jgi:NADP-dependent aldehyde dehydrogenase
MTRQPILVAGEWRDATNPTGTFHAENPSTQQPLGAEHPVSGEQDVDACLRAAAEAARDLRSVPPQTLANFLEDFAARIEADAVTLVETAHVETALPIEPRLKSIELPRTTDQLRKAAAAVREQSWAHAVIDTRINLRSMYGPLGGAVVVFGPNNFPFAYNAVSGGDCAAAIAAGNPVIAKAHPLHPNTSRRLAEAALAAIEHAGLPKATLQMLYATSTELGNSLVARPEVAAVAFTGGRTAGLALKAAAERAGKLVYLELGSTNPVFVLPGALQERGDAIATELSGSCLLGAGQFCTNPGLCVVPEGTAAARFVTRLTDAFIAAPPGTLLGHGVLENLERSVASLVDSGAELLAGGKRVQAARYAFEPTLLRVRGDAFLSRPAALQQEAFGAVNLLVVAQDTEQMVAIAEAIEGNLTGTLYSHSGDVDEAAYDSIARALRPKVGRLSNDKMPTGVAISPAMVHGGPFPSSSHPGFTSVGMPTAIHRFAARHCYDNVRAHRLPSALADQNPTGAMWRSIDGSWTQADITGDPAA